MRHHSPISGQEPCGTIGNSTDKQLNLRITRLLNDGDWLFMGNFTGMSLNIVSLQITPGILSLIVELDEFKGAWKALGTLAPERLSALRRVATIESVGSSTPDWQPWIVYFLRALQQQKKQLEKKIERRNIQHDIRLLRLQHGIKIKKPNRDIGSYLKLSPVSQVDALNRAASENTGRRRRKRRSRDFS